MKTPEFMFLKPKGNELKIEVPQKQKLRRAKSSLAFGRFAVFPLFPVFIALCCKKKKQTSDGKAIVGKLQLYRCQILLIIRVFTDLIKTPLDIFTISFKTDRMVT